MRHLPFGAGSCNFTDTEVALSGSMQAIWTTMAETGSSGVGWAEFPDDSSRGVIFNDVPVTGTVDYSMCAFWNEIAAELPA